MQVEIWSDVMCPFCYIGKRRFEQALAQFEHKEDVKVSWKSFQLDPEMPAHTGKNVYEYLAERKGITIPHAKQLNEQVSAMAAEAGLQYNLDKAIVANSFDAHRFSHLAAQHGLGDAAEESLFKAYFTDGENIADHNVLARLGANIGLDAAEVKTALAGNSFTQDVQADVNEAAELGARGVPFFVIDRKYAVSGAQPAATFLNALQHAFTEQAKQPAAGSDNACDINGDCN